jgi:hypothetical protein
MLDARSQESGVRAAGINPAARFVFVGLVALLSGWVLWAICLGGGCVGGSSDGGGWKAVGFQLSALSQTGSAFFV